MPFAFRTTEIVPVELHKSTQSTCLAVIATSVWVVSIILVAVFGFEMLLKVIVACVSIYWLVSNI